MIGQRVDVYIGDGVYVEYDGYGLILKTERDGKWETIHIDSDVYWNLLAFVEKVKVMNAKGD